MIDSYEVYNLRLNRYGLNYQQRIQNEREENFEYYLMKSIYRIDFDFNGKLCAGTFEQYKQDETRTLHYLLTRNEDALPKGTIIKVKNDRTKLDEHWMVWYIDEVPMSGYNKYIMLRMTHFIEWTARDGSKQSSWAYFYGQENNMLQDELRSRSRSDTIYNEDLKSSFFIMPRNQYIKKDVYLEVGEEPFRAYYRITGYDLASTEGVEYVTIDPTYQYDLSQPPVRTEADIDEDFYWLEGAYNG